MTSSPEDTGRPVRDSGGKPTLGGSGPPLAACVTPAVLACLILAAHFLRSFTLPLVLVFLLLPLLLTVRKAWAVRVVQVALVMGAFEWVMTTLSILGDRRATGEPFGRMVLIMGTVTLLTLLAAVALECRASRRRFGLRTGRLFQTAPPE